MMKDDSANNARAIRQNVDRFYAQRDPRQKAIVSESQDEESALYKDHAESSRFA